MPERDWTDLPMFRAGLAAQSATVAGPVAREVRELRLASPTDVPALGRRPGPLAPVQSPVAATLLPQPDWALVRAFRQQVSEALTDRLRSREGIGEQGRRELGRELIVRTLQEHSRTLLEQGQVLPSSAQERHLVQAVFDALFGLGRLQPLVDDDRIENIEVCGCDNVWLCYADGRVERGPAVADSDEELIDALQFLAVRGGMNERSFTAVNPRLHLRLAGGSRLAASAWTSQRPVVVIRRHRVRDVDLADLVALGMFSPALGAFLAAAVRAGKSIVVSGPMGCGKTTTVRALASAIDPMEPIATFETEFELFLDEMPDRHARVFAFEARPGSGERGHDGRMVGEITLDDLIRDALRLNRSRLVVGEVRGPEALAMLKAMSAGTGSLSTVHARSAHGAVERLVTCVLEAGPHNTAESAYRLVAQNVDLVVQIALRDDYQGKRERFVSEVIQLDGIGEGNRPASTTVFGAGADGRAVPRHRPTFLAELVADGLDPSWFDWAPERPGR